jgi:hypothetical protein
VECFVLLWWARVVAGEGAGEQENKLSKQEKTFKAGKTTYKQKTFPVPRSPMNVAWMRNI